MPLINVRLIENVFTPEQKQQMARDLTDAMVAIEGDSRRPLNVFPLAGLRSSTKDPRLAEVSATASKCTRAGPLRTSTRMESPR